MKSLISVPFAFLCVGRINIRFMYFVSAISLAVVILNSVYYSIWIHPEYGSERSGEYLAGGESSVARFSPMISR